MKKTFFIVSIIMLFFWAEFSIAQGECLGGGCPANAVGYNYPTGTFTTTSDVWTTVATDIGEGHWAIYQVEIGNTYEWSLCPADGGSYPRDSELTLYNHSDLSILCYSNDVCDINAKITWTATFTGLVRVQTNERYFFFGTQFTCESFVFLPTATTLVWRCVDCSTDCDSQLNYPGPYCVDNSATQLPIITGSTSGTFSSSPAGLNLNTSTGAILPSASTPGIYTITYAIPAAGSCPAINLTETVVITALPPTPTLSPDPACAGSNINFIANNGNLYEFLVNEVSQAPFSSNNSFNSAPLNNGDEVCVRSYPPIPFIMDGEINETAWGAALATSAGGPTGSGFGGNNRIDALYLKNIRGTLYGALAGNENDGNDQMNNNWILIFIDSKPGGFNSLLSWVNRSNAPGFTQGVFNLALNNDVIFDPGFEPDYILTMNQAASTAYFDLYDMQANLNNYLGSNVDNPTQFGFTGNLATGDTTKGFEFSFPLSFIGSPITNFKTFAMMVNDPNAGEQTFISNQFLTRANEGENNYGNGYIDFGNAAPNPIDYYLSADCYSETCITVSPVIPPVTGFSYLSPVCENDPNILPVFDDNFVMGGNYNITPASGLVIDPTTREINLSTSTPGTYTISYTVPATGCNPEGTSTFEIIINPLPTTTNIYHD